MLKTREDGWPDDENPCERYLYVTGDGFVNARIVILEEAVILNEDDVTFHSKEELEAWIKALRQAWKMKEDQDAKGWRSRD